MVGSGREARTGGREIVPDVRVWSGVPPGCPGIVGRPSRVSGSDWEALSNVRDWSGGPPGCPGVVWWTFRMTGSSRDNLPDVRVVGRPSRM